MRPFEESYARIQEATHNREPALTVVKIGDDWRVSHHQSHGQAGTLELAAWHLANFVENGGRRR